MKTIYLLIQAMLPDIDFRGDAGALQQAITPDRID
jgi:hypothetical protein